MRVPPQDQSWQQEGRFGKKPRDEQVLAWFPHELEEAWDSGSPLLSDPASRAAVLVFVGHEPLGVANQILT